MESLTTFVSSRGLIKSCGAHNRRPISSRADIDADILARHRPGGSLYVCTDALTAFANEWLPRLESPFVLVSGDSDLPIRPDAIGESTLRTILESALCGAWFAQNLSCAHPKLHALPIGLDYHTMWENAGFWGLSKISPVAQEHLLLDSWARSPEMHQRYLAAYCNWTTSLENGDRRVCLEQIDHSVCFFERGRVPRASTWSRQGEFLFVVSPEGVGIDCHRTWEALLLGCIPIVKRSMVTTLLTHLPVLVVDDWSEVRRETLERYLSDFGRRSFNFSSLFRAHWTRRIHGWPETELLECTHAEFRRLMTRVTA